MLPGRERILSALGDERSKPLFVWPKGNTHLKPEGAVRMAGFLAQGLEVLREDGGYKGRVGSFLGVHPAFSV